MDIFVTALGVALASALLFLTMQEFRRHKTRLLTLAGVISLAAVLIAIAGLGGLAVALTSAIVQAIFPIT